MEITRSFSLFSLLFYLRTGKFAIRWGIGEWWHWIGLQSFLREKLEIGNEKFLVSKFLFLFSERRDDEKFIYFSSSRACYYNKISRHSIGTRLKSWICIFISDARYFVEFRIENIIRSLNAQLPPFLSFWFIFFRRLSTGRRTKTQGTR